MRKLYWQKSDVALLLLRLTFGLMMALHGWQKLRNFSQMSQVFSDPFGLGPAPSLALAIFAELICSMLLVVGFLTPLALAPLLVTMLVAIFYAHAADPWQKKELAAAYLAVYATLICSGPGRYSLDHLLFGPKREG
jgi:putative oxidoreductase